MTWQKWEYAVCLPNSSYGSLFWYYHFHVITAVVFIFSFYNFHNSSGFGSLYKCIHCVIFWVSKKFYPLTNTCLSLLSSFWNSLFYSVSIIVADSVCQWNSMLFLFLCWTYFNDNGYCPDSLMRVQITKCMKNIHLF